MSSNSVGLGISFGEYEDDDKETWDMRGAGDPEADGTAEETTETRDGDRAEDGTAESEGASQRKLKPSGASLSAGGGRDDMDWDTTSDEDDDNATGDGARDPDTDDGLSDVDASELDLDDFLEMEEEDEMFKLLSARIPAGFVNPLAMHPLTRSPSRFSLGSGSDSNGSFVEIVIEESPPMINGVEVELFETKLSDVEFDFYSDERYGQFRCSVTSPLRQCWMPIRGEI